MLRCISHRRAGMTLVELLMVVAILSLLTGLAVPMLSASSDSRRTREASRSVSSFIAKAHSRAIGRTEWTGFWLTPPASRSNAHFCLDLFLAEVPAVFRGLLVSSTVTVSGGTVTNGSIGVNDPVSGTFGVPGDLVRFDGKGNWYRYLSTSSFDLRADANQTTINTPWPAPAPATHSFELLRQPIRAGSPLSLADGRCVDLFWSGFGANTNYTPFSSLPSYSSGGTNPHAIAVLFDAAGRLQQLFANSQWQTPSGAVFLLIGRADRAGQGVATINTSDDSVGANWQYGDSYWIGIDPISGVAKSAECATGANNVTGDVTGSQAFIRSEILATGR